MNSRAPWLHGRYSASSLLRAPPPPSRLRPLSRGIPVIRPTLLRRFLGGTRTASPVAQRILVTVLPSLKQRKLGLQNHLCRGHPWVHLRCGPVTRSPSRRWLCQSASEHLVSLLSATRATGLLTLALAGLAPAGCASLRLDALCSQNSSAAPIHLPRRTSRLQWSRSRLRCQEMTVLGFTKTRASSQPNHARVKHTQSRRSAGLSRRRCPIS
jgi:hypothetical protein